MITLNNIAGYDNQVIWFYRIYLNNGNVIYLTDKDNGESFSSTGGNTYDGTSLEQYSNVIDEFYDFSNGGDLGSVASITLSITRNSSNSLLDAFHNEFYPNTSIYLSGAKVELGIGWDNMPNEGRITWLYEFYIHDIIFNYDKFDLTLYSYDFYNIELPKHIAQKDNEYANYYFENLDDDNVGLPLPLLYGNMAIYMEYGQTSTLQNYFPKRLAYTICVDKKLSTYMYATHKCKTTISDISFYNAAGTAKDLAVFKYIENAESYLELTPTEGILVNNYGNSYIQLIKDDDTIDQFIYGSIMINKMRKGSITKYMDIQIFSEFYRLGDRYISQTYNTELSCLINSGINDNDIGLLSSVNNNHIKIRVLANANDTDNVNFRIYRYNNNLFSYSSDYIDCSANTPDGAIGSWGYFDFPFATSTSAKNDSSLPYTIDDFNSIEFVIKNNTSGEILRVRSVQLIMENILISEVKHTADDYWEYYNRLDDYINNGGVR